MDKALMDLIANSPSDCDKTLTKIQVPLPAFIVDDKNSTQVEYFKKACYVKDEYLFNGFARVYRQQPKIGESYVNEQAVAEVWHSENAFAQKLGMDVIVEKMVAFVEGYKRWGGEGNHYLRRTQLPEDIGLILNEKEIDGRIRRWHMFEPSAYKKGLKEKYPLVIAIHGFSCSGPFFAENSGWHAVAESRGFLLVYPTAYPNEPAYSTTRMGEKRNLTATPEWNSGGMNPSPNAPDEISFYKQMVAEIEKNYPVDPERIYVTGHSNGSMMTQKLMRFWPEKFAGFAPVGAMECRRGNLEAPTDGVKRNVWYTIGEFDGEGINLEGDNGNTRTLKMICQANGLEYDLSRRYSTGIYNTVTIRDAEKVPMVRFTGVTNWPHTYSPELAFMIYDEFFAQFIRKEDGELVYLA